MPPRLGIATPAPLHATRLGGVLLTDARARAGASEGALVVAEVASEALVLGAFQRAASTVDLDRVARTGMQLARRSTGGTALHARPGQVFFALELANAAALGGTSDPARALNRHVRPLLSALGRLGIAATYGGRDFVQAKGAPIAWLGVTHDVKSGSIGIEALFAVDEPFTLTPADDLAHGAVERWLGKTPSTLAATLGRNVASSEVIAAIVDVYGAHARGETSTFELGGARALDPRTEDPPFGALVEEAMGLLGALVEGTSGSGRHALGGELMASPHALDAVARALDQVDDAHIEATLDAHLGPSSGALLFGVKSLASIAKVVRAARAARR